MRVVFEPKGETADAWLIREAARFAPYWLVTSDRELRELAGPRSETGDRRRNLRERTAQTTVTRTRWTALLA